MGCSGSTPVKADLPTKRSDKQQQPQHVESPCLGLEDDYAFKQKLGQGEASPHVQRAPSQCAPFWQHTCGKMLRTNRGKAAGGTGLTYLAEDRKTKELVAVKLIKRPIPKVLEQNILREVVVSTQLAAASCFSACYTSHASQINPQSAATRGARREYSS